VLGPPPIAAPVFPGDDGSAVNNISVVMLARWPGLSALLTGDAEEDEQRALVEAGLPPATVLKIPHHGSDRQDAGFLAASGARLALISVGRANDYGHPAPELSHLLHRLRMRSYRTDQHGDIAITRSEDGLAVVPRGPSPTGRDGDRTAAAPAAGTVKTITGTTNATRTSGAQARGATTDGATTDGDTGPPRFPSASGRRPAPGEAPAPRPSDGPLNPRAEPRPRRASRDRRARR
jgi:hypothetical protein